MAELGTLITLFIIVYIIIHFLKKGKRHRRSRHHRYSRKRRTPRARTRPPAYEPRVDTTSRYGTPTPPITSPTDRSADNFRKRARELERAGAFQEAAELYLMAGEVFSAAKAMASQGPEYVPQAVAIIEAYAPNRVEMIVRNLVRYFYDRNDLQTAARLFREIGLTGEAEALEAIAQTSPSAQSASISAPAPSAPASVSAFVQPSVSTVSSQPQPQISAEPVRSEKPLADISLEKTKAMVATSDLNEKCMLCRKNIRSGEIYVKCPHCQNIAHRSHLMEWVKVKAICPVCRQRLTTEMFS